MPNITNIIIKVDFQVQTLDDSTLTRDEAKRLVEDAIADGLLMFDDSQHPQPFIQRTGDDGKKVDMWVYND